MGIGQTSSRKKLANENNSVRAQARTELEAAIIPLAGQESGRHLVTRIYGI
jgi:hypothetical protein